jgi:hypothetical protein
MKNLILIVSFMLAFCFNACSSQTAVPEKVKTAFQKKFPAAVSVKWDNEEENEWEADFKSNNKKMSATFDNEGKWLETESKLNKKEIPEAVANTLNKEFKDFKIEEVASVETPEYKGYEIKLEVDEADIELVIDSNGSILKKEVITEENEDKD